ncbi:MAG: type IV pili twitching motility protein PilT [Candidatus Fischerbacteria bacterium RBG_13_37_8]|uniref:Type IV pili twitching motility protein PilT n=1 Tax=Candidatus Fischerbacteria bacterium RBG_13_37_8 TaxID=1817863 RepID=A0A1F5VDV7_9BACT|nr:MAG: type IV pili twitching motility protein PilT [Candidatus Fischerbacteria bacterium RBG_13_37_8]
MNKIDRFLKLMNDKGASDLHLSVGSPPVLRVYGDLERLRYKAISQTDYENLMGPIVPKGIWAAFVKAGEYDFAYHLEGVGRFRVNIFKQEKGMGATFRIIPDHILSLEELGLPAQIEKYAMMDQGLILTTGPTGSGKSTTLAAIINHINENKKFHIITIEDPIEFVHQSKKSLITQRELGQHTTSFADALRAAIREDPDCILVGEMRDLETISTALHAAETGILVFATLHTNSAAKSIDRIIGVFPADEQEEIRIVLSHVLRGIVSQQLLKRTEGGRIAAIELLFSSSAVANAVREGKTAMINSVIQTGKKQGMYSMDQCLMEFVMSKIVFPEEAYEKSIDKETFKAFLKEHNIELKLRAFEG